VALADEYRRQYAWRSWGEIFAVLPDLQGTTVLDLGCGPGDLAVALAARGARVIGVDANEELLAAARASMPQTVELRVADLSELGKLRVVADGIWSSFAAAYLTDLPKVLRAWARLLRPGGWIVLTEVDDLFGHEPVTPRTRALFAAFAADALAAGRYDFHMGRKLRGYLEAVGFEVKRELSVGDRELAFDGPATPEVLEAWRERLDRMRLLQAFCGAEFAALRQDFLGALAREDHRSVATVQVAFARCEVATGSAGTPPGRRAGAPRDR
jgi:SAM-dependent methyltransferase